MNPLNNPLTLPSGVVIIQHCLVAAVVVGLAVPGSGQADSAANPANAVQASYLFGEEHCSRTTLAAYTACYYEVKDDDWIGWAKCHNVADEAERDECFVENGGSTTEAASECLEQAEARDEVCDLIGQDRYDPEYEPTDFVNPGEIGTTVAANPYLPLVPGYRWVYEGDGETIVVEVLDEVRVIDGVTCAVVRDRVYEVPEEGSGSVLEQEDDEEQEGDLAEDTHDWFAQDQDGNVWYFGEISVNYEDGEISDVEGSWESGEDGARPGILVHAEPVPGSTYRQEFLLGDAEDVAQVVALDAHPDLAENNAGDCSGGCLQTLETNPLNPGGSEFKYYQPGVGLVQEAHPDSEESVELVEFSSSSL